MQDLLHAVSPAPQANLLVAVSPKSASRAVEGGEGLADPFGMLLQLFAGQLAPTTDDALADEAAGNQNPSMMPAMNLPKGNNGETSFLTLCGVPPEGMPIPEDLEGIATNADEISPELMAQIAAMIQQFPQLREAVNAGGDLKVVADAVKALQQNPGADLSQLKLPEKLKADLTALAQTKPAELADFGKLIEKVQQQPEMLKAIQIAAASDKPIETNFTDTPVMQAAGQELPKPKDVAENKAPIQGIHNHGEHKIAEVPLMIDEQVNAAAPQFQVTLAAKQNEIEPQQTVLNFDQAMTQAMQASENLQAGKHSIMGADGIRAYSAAQQQEGGQSPQAAAVQVAVQIQRQIQAGRENHFRIQLQPEELGHVEVSLKFEGKRVRAVIAVEKEETLALMKKDCSVLDRALQNAGLETDAGSMEFTLNQNFQNFAQAKRNHAHEREFGTMIANTNLDTQPQPVLSAAHVMMLAEGRVDVKL